MKKIKWLTLVLALALMVPAAMGSALITKGSTMLALQGGLDFATAGGTELKLDARYAYFVADRIALGGKTTLFNNDAANYFGIGVIGEYCFRLPEGYQPLFGTDLVPYLGVSLEYRHAKLFDQKESAIVLGGEGGLKFFLTDSAAITLALVGEVASEDIYADDLDATNLDLSIQLGMRFYF